MSSDDEYEYNSPLLEPDCILHDEEDDSNSYKNSINNISNHSEFSVYPIPNKQQRIKPPEILATLRPPRIQLVVCDDEDDDSVVRAGNITLSNIGAQPPINNNPLHYQARKITPLSKCPFCLKYFRRMRSHLKLHHDKAMSKSSVSLVGGGEGQIHTCTLCTKSFNSFSNLSIHMRTHTGDKPYICTFCEKAFAQSCNLVNHLRTHTGERPYKCPICLRGFTQSGNLNNHMRLHSDDKPFKCHACNKAFTQSGNLNSHIRNNHRNNNF